MPGTFDTPGILLIFTHFERSFTSAKSYRKMKSSFESDFKGKHTVFKFIPKK